MTLSQKYIDTQKSKSMKELFDYAVKIHRQLQENVMKDIIDFPLESDAASLHELFYSHFPSSVFHAYVNYVHADLNRPNWLAGRSGVSWTEEFSGKRYHFQEG